MLRLLLAALPIAGQPLAAQSCSYSAAHPSAWQRADTAALSLFLPRDAYAKDLSSADSSTWRFRADGLEVTIDYGHSADRQPPAQWTTSRLLGGGLAFIADETSGRDAGRLDIAWPDAGQTGTVASLAVVYTDAARRDDACRIVSGARLLDAAASLALLRTGSVSGQRFAVIRESNGSVRRVVVGDQAAANWGRVSQIGADTIELTERIVDARGGWTSRQVQLRQRR